jgi:hypothetical protein
LQKQAMNGRSPSSKMSASPDLFGRSFASAWSVTPERTSSITSSIMLIAYDSSDESFMKRTSATHREPVDVIPKSPSMVV